MLIINGVETNETAYVFGVNTQQASKVKTDDYTVTFADTGMLLVMNSSSDKTFTLPAADAAHVGCWFTFANINTGRLTLEVTGAGVQLAEGTAATGTIYCDEDAYANITIELMSATKWSIVGAHGTWTTT